MGIIKRQFFLGAITASFVWTTLLYFILDSNNSQASNSLPTNSLKIKNLVLKQEQSNSINQNEPFDFEKFKQIKAKELPTYDDNRDEDEVVFGKRQGKVNVREF